MSRCVDVLAVLDAAKRVATLCDPSVRAGQHPLSNSLEAQAYNLRGEIDEARAAVAELIEAMEKLFGADMEYCMEMDGKADQLEAVHFAKSALARVRGDA